MHVHLQHTEHVNFQWPSFTDSKSYASDESTKQPASDNETVQDMNVVIKIFIAVAVILCTALLFRVWYRNARNDSATTQGMFICLVLRCHAASKLQPSEHTTCIHGKCVQLNLIHNSFP